MEPDGNAKKPGSKGQWVMPPRYNPWRRPVTWLIAGACLALPLAGLYVYQASNRGAGATDAAQIAQVEPVAEAAQTEAVATAGQGEPATMATAGTHLVRTTDTADSSGPVDAKAQLRQLMSLRPLNNDLKLQPFEERVLARREDEPSLEADSTHLLEHVVAEGENIWLIALEYGTDMESIAAINDIGVSEVLRPGQKLRVIVGTEGLVHTVAEGDTIEMLAGKYDIRVEAIRIANSLWDDNLAIGLDLILPGARAPQRRTVQVASVSRGGGGSSSADRSLDGFIWPHHGMITSYYGWRDEGFHSGIDLDGYTGDPIMAAKSGTVTHAGWGWAGFGIYIVVDHGDGTKTIYAHLSDTYVVEGEEVGQGEVIGALGNTGWSTGSHLHFEILVNGANINPLPSLP